MFNISNSTKSIRMNIKEYIKQWAESYKTDLTENIMPFWMEHGWDKVNGGVYTCVDSGSRGDLPSSALMHIIM